MILVKYNTSNNIKIIINLETRIKQLRNTFNKIRADRLLACE